MLGFIPCLKSFRFPKKENTLQLNNFSSQLNFFANITIYNVTNTNIPISIRKSTPNLNII